ncbi:hypothetical protein DFJ73DRAFT_86625 [Zopfochytrium polystomum]|nr:hypothetical protein DFJ73DRAFT_86625 [Zopfochytrium polystomum]
MAVFARLSMVVIVSTAVCAGAMTGLALTESALRDRMSVRPPDSPSLYLLGGTVITQCLSSTTYLALTDWRELGSRRFSERLGLLALGWVSFAALCAVLVASATHRTAIIVVSPFLRVFGLAIMYSLSNVPSSGLRMRKLLESVCYGVVDALVAAASMWFIASLVSLSDLSEAAHVSRVVISLPLVITMLGLEQLCYQHMVKSIERGVVVKESNLDKVRSVSRAVMASISSVAIPVKALESASTTRSSENTALHTILPAMFVTSLNRKQSIIQLQW